MSRPRGAPIGRSIVVPRRPPRVTLRAPPPFIPVAGHDESIAVFDVHAAALTDHKGAHAPGSVNGGSRISTSLLENPKSVSLRKAPADF